MSFLKCGYATVKRIVEAGKSGKSVLGGEVAKDLLEEITKNVIRIQAKSGTILEAIERELATEQIFIIDEKQVSAEQATFINDYFFTKGQS